MGERKKRSDTKREVKPLLPIIVKDAIYQISYKTHTSVKNVCEYLVVATMNDRKVLTDLSAYFQRNLKFEKTIFFGNLNKQRIKKRFEGYKETVTMKLKYADYEFICELGYALDCRPTVVVAILLQVAIRDICIVESYMKNHSQK